MYDFFGENTRLRRPQVVQKIHTYDFFSHKRLNFGDLKLFEKVGRRHKKIRKFFFGEKTQLWRRHHLGVSVFFFMIIDVNQ